MNADSKLSLKCPSCGNTHQKSLSAIKAQSTFECSCGFSADIQPHSLLRPREHKIGKPTTVAPPRQHMPEEEDALAITA